nr:MAG: DoxX family protein [Bacillota bacterium]
MKPSARLLSQSYPDIAILFIRIPVGFHLIYGTQDNVFSWSRMLEFSDFLQHHGFPFPTLCAITSVYAQFISGAAYILGFKTRLAAAVMTFNFIVAIIGVHLGDSYTSAFPAIMMLCSSVFLLLNGPGRYSIN